MQPQFQKDLHGTTDTIGTELSFFIFIVLLLVLSLRLAMAIRYFNQPFGTTQSRYQDSASHRVPVAGPGPADNYRPFHLQTPDWTADGEQTLATNLAERQSTPPFSTPRQIQK